jgi:hypothetical protein
MHSTNPYIQHKKTRRCGSFYLPYLAIFHSDSSCPRKKRALLTPAPLISRRCQQTAINLPDNGHRRRLSDTAPLKNGDVAEQLVKCSATSRLKSYTVSLPGRKLQRKPGSYHYLLTQRVPDNKLCHQRSRNWLQQLTYYPLLPLDHLFRWIKQRLSCDQISEY